MPSLVTVHVATLEGKEVKIKGMDNWTLARFRQGLRDWYKTDKPYSLFFNNRELHEADDNKLLPTLGIVNDSKAQLVLKLTVTVKSMDGKVEEQIVALENWTFKRFKDAVNASSAAVEQNNKVLYRGKQLTDTEDHRTLKELEFESGGIVQLVTRSTGG